MAYLGIKNDEMKGLYYFETISVRDEIAKHFTNVCKFKRIFRKIRPPSRG